MKVLIIGYGKMGKEIEKICLTRGHEIVDRISIDSSSDLIKYSGKNVDVAIEFSDPSSAFENIKYCLENDIPVVSGTTGWLDKRSKVEDLCAEKKGTFFYASNYSIGVNLFFHLNKTLAKIMSKQGDYSLEIEEIHHTQKKDAPSGTAISLAEGIIENSSYTQWTMNEPINNEIKILSKRIDPAPGTHVVTYSSEIDDIEIKHTAHSRKGFATGAVLVAEWIKDKKGVYNMRHFLEELK